MKTNRYCHYPPGMTCDPLDITSIYRNIQNIITKIFAWSSAKRKLKMNSIRALSVVFLLAILLASIQAATAATFTVTSTFAYGNVNNGGTEPSCYRTATSWGGVNGAYVSYGIPSGGTCPGSLNLATQSGFGSVAQGTQTVSDASLFKLGSFTHYNHPITANNLFNTIDLTVGLTITGANPATTYYTYTQHLDETSNSLACGCAIPGSPGCCKYGPCVPAYNPCPDKAYWDNTQTTSSFTGEDGKVYTLVVKGFADCNNPGIPSTEFITQENTNNVACFYAQICAVPVITPPQSLLICPPAITTASFSVTTDVTGPSYQWYKEAGATDTKLTNTAPYSGVTTATLTINPATSAQAGAYYCVVTGSCGASSASSPATLTVVPYPDISMDIAIT